MRHDDTRQPPGRETGPPDDACRSTRKPEWVEPRLEFVEPRLTMHGDLQRVTGAFFGTFSP